MRPPVSVIASAVLTLVASALSVLFGFLMFTVRGDMGSEVPAAERMAVAIAAFFAAGGILGIATAVDLLRLRHWARIALLVFAGLIVVFGVFSILIFLVLPWDQVMANAPRPTRDIRPILAGIYLVPIAIGTWWLILFTRPAMKERFAAGRPAEPTAVPLAIAVIGWITLIGGVASVALPFFKVPAFLVGLVITGWGAAVVHVLLALAYVYAGLGLLRLDERGRRVAIGLYALAVVQGLLMLLVPSVRARAEAASALIMPVPDAPVMMDAAGLKWGTTALLLVVFAVTIWLLIKWRVAFTERRGS